MCFGGQQIDAWSLSDGEGAAQFVFPDYPVGDFDPSLGVDRLAGDLKPIPDSDNLRDPGLTVGDSVLGHAFGGWDDSCRRGDFCLPGGAFQNIYLREAAAGREYPLRSFPQKIPGAVRTIRAALVLFLARGGVRQLLCQ
jgi:hypothetical protein